jgi:hypothetical protein
MKNFKIVQHPTLGTKAVREDGWSWWGFFFFGWYFLFKGRVKDFFISWAISASVIGIGWGLKDYINNLYWDYSFSLDTITDENLTFMALQYLDEYSLIIFIWLSQIGMWIHGGLLGNKSRYAKLISQGFECVDDFEANNSPHAIALFEKSKQAS